MLQLRLASPTVFVDINRTTYFRYPHFKATYVRRHAESTA